MRNASLKLLVLTLVGLFLTNCQREEAPEAPQQEPVPAVDPQAVVSLNEAKSLFEASENQKRTTNSVSRSNYPLIELETDWRYFEQMKDIEEMPYAKVPVRISRTELNGEVLFLKKDGKTEQYLFLPQIDSITADRRIINAEFYLLDTKGVFLSAYRMTDGVITHKIVPKRKGSYRIIENNEASVTARSGKPICVSCRFIITPPPIFSPGKEPNEREDDGDGGGGGNNYFVLEPVTVYGKFTKKSRNNSDFPHYTYYDYSPYNYGDFYDDRDSDDTRKLREKRSAGGGGSSSNIGAGMAKEDEKKEEKKQDKREDTIKDSLTNPCAKALLAQAPNLNNDIAKILRETFGTNDKYNITVTEKPLSGMSGYSSFPEVRQNSIKAIIYLNSNMLGTATQEYALATIYHEVIHVFLNAEHAKLGETVFNQKYPSVTYQDYPVGNGQQTRRYKLRTDHSRFDAFLEKLAQSIISFNPNFTLERARAIAKEGIVEDFFISPTDATFIQEQKNGTNGTKCP